MNHSEFLIKANKVHNNKYDYSKTVYVNAKTYITVTCLIHGDFSQQGYAHLRGRGCKHCGVALTQEEYFSKVNDIFKNKYTYPFPYTGRKDLLTIVCPIHGEFQRKAGIHLLGVGCGECSGKRQYSLELFVKEAVEIHGGGVYDYSNTKYKTKNSKVDILCIKHNSVFSVTPNNHISKKSGCPICATALCGYTRSNYIERAKKYGNKAKLYILKCFNDKEEFYKIGITMMSIKQRYRNKQALPYEYSVHSITEGPPGFIWDLEKKLHNKFAAFSYKPDLSFAGQTECFKNIPVELLKALDIC